MSFQQNRIVIQCGSVVTADASQTILNDCTLLVEGGRIASLLPRSEFIPTSTDQIIDASRLVAIPGFIQTHVHLCQTLFRGLADDLELLDWLQLKIFPFEAAHSGGSMRASALIGIMELMRSGTTTILDMGSIHHQEEVIRAVGESGLRAFVGKAMMDMNDAYPGLRESTREAVHSTRHLAERWHNSFNGRLRYAAAPRFVLSCTDTLLHETRDLLQGHPDMMLHTHASENRGEVEQVRRRTRKENIEFLHECGLLSQRSCLAHCIHLSDGEVSILQETGTHVSHCPSSNLKLGSGIANVPKLMNAGINVSLGADGAPCNNTLDMFQEMRFASFLQKITYGPRSMPAEEVFLMATRNGAKALGLDREIGTLEVGKKADIVLLDLEQLWNPISPENVYSVIVYSASPENVHSVMIDGTWTYQKKEFTSLDASAIRHQAGDELRKLLNRIPPA